MKRDGQIYLDYLSTTPTDPTVVRAMEPYWSDMFGNPHSRGHAFGLEAAGAVERARSSIAKLAEAQSHNITFTSGATEANNIALKGMAEMALATPKRRRMLIPPSEHACVLRTVLHLQDRFGMEAQVIPVCRDGVICMDEFETLLGEGHDVAFVSVMLANNETGVLQPIDQIGAMCAARGVPFHVDAAQGLGKVAIDVNIPGLTSMSFSGHKMYGPMGIGALWTHDEIQSGLPPLLHGGGQERGLRSGTVPAPLCVGYGKACEIAVGDLEDEMEHVSEIRDAFQALLMDGIDGVTVNAINAPRLPGACNMRICGVEAGLLIQELPHLSFSMASACATAKKRPSHVLESMGLADLAHECFRVSFGRFSDMDQMQEAAHDIIAMAKRLRKPGEGPARAA